MKIHTVGDSHCKEGFRNVISHHLGPILCYSFGQNPLQRCPIKTFGLRENDVLIFCFGEIDCRCHIHKHISKEKSFQDVVDEIIEKYIQGILTCIKSLKVKVKVSVFNVVPTVRRDDALENEAFPFLGSDEERKSYVLYFNEKLKEHCEKQNFIYFDIYNFYADDEGFLRREIKDESVHIKDFFYFDAFIQKHFMD
jgi:hypothetical protein